MQDNVPVQPSIAPLAGPQPLDTEEQETELLVKQLLDDFQRQAPQAREPFVDRELSLLFVVAMAILGSIGHILIFDSGPILDSSHRELLVVIAIPTAVLIFCALLFGVASATIRQKSARAAAALRYISEQR